MNTNKDCVVKISVQGEIVHPGRKGEFITDGEGNARVLPATGGIVYNTKVGDCCMNWAADHLEPGVTTCNSVSDMKRNGYSVYSCIGNEARIITGDAKGAKGYVTGQHDMSNVLIYFDDDTLDKLTLDDKILIKGYGQGFSLTDYPEVYVMNIDPDLFERMGIREENGKLIIPVAKKIPPYLMGSGIGASSPYRSDYDIMTQDTETIKELGLDTLRFGDIVLLEDCDNCFGRGYFKGATTIGVVSHGHCFKPGHGPGVSTILSTKEPLITCVIDSGANIANYHLLTHEEFQKKLEAGN